MKTLSSIRRVNRRRYDTYRFLIVLTFLATTAIAQSRPAPPDRARTTVSDITREELVSFERSRVIAQADRFLNETPITVTAVTAPRSAGGAHDFFSEGDYWWPDPSDPSKPYVRRDGETNPDNFESHRSAMRRLSVMVPALTAAFEITGNARYARHAVTHLRAWFVAESTRMNPNLMYAQAIKGVATGRGIGIIDTIHLVEVAQAALELERLGAFSGPELAGTKEWFREYTQWMTTSKFGLDERNNGNNHSAAWALQVAAFSRFTATRCAWLRCASSSPVRSFRSRWHRTAASPRSWPGRNRTGIRSSSWT